MKPFPFKVKFQKRIPETTRYLSLKAFLNNFLIDTFNFLKHFHNNGRLSASMHSLLFHDFEKKSLTD